MGNWLSIAAALFLAAMVLYGHYRGFIRLAVSATSLVVALFIVQAAMPHVTGYLKANTGIYHLFEEGMRKAAGLETEQDIQEPSEQRNAIEEMGLPKQLKDALLENNNYEIYHALGVDTFTEYISGYLANSVFNIAGFLFLFIVVFAVLHFITAWLDLVAKLPILSGINKLAGATLGAVEGLIVLWLLCLLVTLFAGTGIGKLLIAQIEDSIWLSYLFDHNFLSSLVMMAIKNVL